MNDIFATMRKSAVAAQPAPPDREREAKLVECLRIDPLYMLAHQLMVALGVLASAYGQDEDADAVSRTVELTMEDPTGYRINRALAQGIHGKGEAAKETLQTIIDANPGDDRTKVVLAVTMMLSGDPGWQNVLEGVFATSSDPVARSSASNVIAYLLNAKF